MPEDRHGLNLSREQQRVVSDFGSNQFVSAGAGSGKTRVVIEGIVDALARGDVRVDQVLAITFTDKAAGEMIRRARDRLTQRGMLEERRLIEQARISTIHSFCSSLIRSHALALGLDPGFTVADEAHATLLKEQAFSRCFEVFIEEHGEVAMELYSEFDGRRTGELAAMIIALYDELRSRGQPQPQLDLTGLSAAEAAAGFKAVLEEALVAFDDSGSKAEDSVRRPMVELLDALGQPDPQARLRLVLGAKPKALAIKDHVAAVLHARKLYLGTFFIDKLELLRDLLVEFGGEYTRAKHAASLLDFEDLQLQALRLLEENPGLCESIAASFRIIVVDEFQDTNGLQYRIVGKLARDNVCFVGDENQSIYRFRHADVDLFRHKRALFEAEGRGRPLSINFRSQPEILAFVNRVFGADGMLAGGGYLRMESGAKPDGGGEAQRVEAIIVDASQGEGKGRGAPVAVTRPAEAELVARRLSELLGPDRDYRPGDCVILVHRRRDADLLRDALERHGIPAYLSIGNDYYRKLELGDALGLLRLLVNPLDDIALLAVLRSPLVGLDDDSLILLRRCAGYGRSESSTPPLWPAAVSRECLETLSNEQAERLAGFIEDYGRLRDRSRRQPLESTVREVIGYRDYAAIAAAGGDGRSSLANLMKLIDLAAAYEESWGSDLPSFVDFLVRQQDREMRESEAPTEEEGSTSVQIMTIHSAKGLEFPVVVWAYMGDVSNRRGRTIMLDGEGRIGLKYPALEGARDDDRKLFHFDEIDEWDKSKEDEEHKRIGYVAMTRAERHLILCGSAMCANDPGGPSSRAPMEWVRHSLDLGPENGEFTGLAGGDELIGNRVLDSIDGCPVRLTLCSDPMLLLEQVDAVAEGYGSREIPPVPQDIKEMPPPASYVPAYISASSLSIYGQCPRRYYLEQQVRVGREEEPAGEKAEGEAGLQANRMGTLVHAVLERSSFYPEAGIDTGKANLEMTASEVLGADTELTPRDHERAAYLLENLKQAPVLARMVQAEARSELRREQDFLTLLGGTTILSGTIDVICREGKGMLVVDYKTDRIGDDGQLRHAAQHHAPQMSAYALAAGRQGSGGAVEVVLVFLDRPEAQVSTVFEAGQIAGLEAELMQQLASMSDGRFPALPVIDYDFCPGCAGFAGEYPLCATASLK